jgi:hypothetical protein
MERLICLRVGLALPTMEASMKHALLGLTAAAFVLASPAFAQMSTGNTSTPGIGVSKDDQTYQKTTKSKKHATSQTKRKHASNAKRHNGKPMNPKPQTTGSGSSSVPGVGVNKDDTVPKR